MTLLGLSGGSMLTTNQGGRPKDSASTCEPETLQSWTCGPHESRLHESRLTAGSLLLGFKFAAINSFVAMRAEGGSNPTNRSLETAPSMTLAITSSIQASL
ncbi:uncharacterized protein PGTG_17117 [Puccinia graminis f. sp. tritici CRL 75-36-700-3]|uniref:Uncharacterized protein n=1 Tax=Puccinia graminis f. sp. tritici (strain CRL 75-36-700-3 / race SCCL) TaxID=418459 RepID=E3L3Y5_PUCGT|nr:uncharacterized protein PGTG_17117 [Puccinia graminis f. sp. tritici CRL 75-36-700-3]EFP91260.2 hypothetical protein PGTG_17117 [Puccinia graminis f. sp. tritici CRL 75-36-700-3]